MNATPLELLTGIQHRATGFLPPKELPGRVEIEAALRTCHEDIHALLKMVEQRTGVIQYAIGVVERIAQQADDECRKPQCTLEHPVCAVRIAQAELAGRLGQWKT